MKLTPIQSGSIQASISSIDERHLIPDEEWIKHATSKLEEYNSQDDPKLTNIHITWSGYQSYNQSAEDIRPPASIGLFPEFYEKAATLDMQKHGMIMMAEATEYLNPGQTPVVEGDCPLYMIMKKLQLLFSEEIGTEKIVTFMGLIHMCVQECGGKLLGGSGWEDLFNVAGVFTSGVCMSLLGGRHVKRTREAYELTLLWLSIMKDRAWETTGKLKARIFLDQNGRVILMKPVLQLTTGALWMSF